MFRALVETRSLSERMGKKVGLPKGLEACWVGTALDLQPGDLVSGLHGKGFGQFVREAGARKTDRAATSAEFKRVAERVVAEKPFAGSASDAVCCAVGQAMALGAAEGKNVVVAYAGAEELTPADWRRVLAVAKEGALPLAVVTIPAIRTRADAVDLSAIAGKILGANIPVIPVDAGDAVALYRVMQETCVRARADGGVAVIECVRCGTDPIRQLGTQLRTKGISTERWISKVEAEARALGEPPQGHARGNLGESRRLHSRGPAA